MKNSNIKKLIKDGASAATDKKNPQQRRVIAAAGKLRVQVGKGNPANGKTNN